MADYPSISSLSKIRTMNQKRKAPSSVGLPDNPKKFKQHHTPSEYSQTHVFKSPSAQNKFKPNNTSSVNLPTQSKSPSRIGSPGKLKHSKQDDNSSVFSLSLAYGNCNTYDSDDDVLSTSEGERSVDLIKLDTTLLNRDEGVLFSEDLTDDYEIWTCQCPDDVDIEELQEQFISFDDISTARISNSMSHKVNLIPYKSQENTNIAIMLPSEETSNLTLNVLPLAGKLIITNRVKKEKPANLALLPVDTIEDATRRRAELMSKINQRLSNKYNIDSVHDISIKKQIKVEKESPKKVKKSNKHK